LKKRWIFLLYVQANSKICFAKFGQKIQRTYLLWTSRPSILGFWLHLFKLFLLKNHNLIELRKPLILSYTNNCISITQTMLFIRIIFSYGWETAMILYKKTFIYLKNNNENKNTMFNKTQIKKKYPFIFFFEISVGNVI
jgi:hypothetical protein